MPRKKSKAQVGRNLDINYSSHSKNIWAIYYHKRASVFMWSTRYSCQIFMKLEFSRQIFEKSRTSIFMKICPAGPEIFHADGQTDTTKLIVTFRHFANAISKSKMFSAAHYVELCYITLNTNKCHVRKTRTVFRKTFSRAYTCLSNFSAPWDLLVNLFRY
jgi:hypothetical protein